MTTATQCKRPWSSRLAKRIPAVVLEQPWAIFVKTLCIISGLSTFVGPAPGTIEATLPQAVVSAWSITLVVGAGCALYGLLQPRHREVELLGLVWLGTASLVYAVTIATRFGTGGAVPCAIVLAFSLAALVRALAVYLEYEIAKRVRR